LDRVEARGYLWATPGPYLRKSMLLTLARRISDQFLPEVFYDSTFTIADGCPQRSPEDEEDLAMGFDHKMQDALAEKDGEEEGSEDSDGDGD
jgi:cell wall assembly regulator SMI1